MWSTTDTFDAVLRPVRGLDREVTGRGAFQLHVGSAETDVRIRFVDGRSLEPGRPAFVRMHASRRLVIDVFDRFVLREVGRGVTVAGGVVLDVAPPRRRRGTSIGVPASAAAARAEVASMMVRHRGAVRADDVQRLTGSTPSALTTGAWLVADELVDAVAQATHQVLREFHRAHPLRSGAPVPHVRNAVAATLRASHVRTERELIDAVLERLVSDGAIARVDGTIRLPDHSVALDVSSVARLRDAVTGSHETAPPTIGELVDMGFDRDLIDAAAVRGDVVKVGHQLIMAPSIVERAAVFARSRARDGMTVSEMRIALGTTRKYAVPLAEHLDANGVTRREGDRRYPR